MKAIIFAAGVGKRLQAFTQGLPKCLVTIDGQTLLARHLEHLQRLGVEGLVLVVGYKHEAIRDAIENENPFSGDIRWVVNEQYTRGSITSLWAARSEMNDDVILMDADVLYAHEILCRLVTSRHTTALLMDENVRQDSEECMVSAIGQRVIRLSKSIPSEYEDIGEGVGFLRVKKEDIPVLLEAVQRHIDAENLDMEYEDALQEFFERVPVGYEKIGGLPWVEIDFPEDVKRATDQVLPAIHDLENNTFEPFLNRQ